MHQQLQLRRRINLSERHGGAMPPPSMPAPPIRLSERTTAACSDLFYYDSLEADSHRPEVQTIIRDGIRRGTIRVRPVPGCENRVKISQVHPMQPAP